MRFFTNSAKLHFTSTPWSDLLAVVTTELLQLWWLSHVIGPGFEPGLVLEIFFVSQIGRGFEPLLRHTFFCNKRVAENIPVLSGRLVQFFILKPLRGHLATIMVAYYGDIVFERSSTQQSRTAYSKSSREIGKMNYFLLIFAGVSTISRRICF